MRGLLKAAALLSSRLASAFVIPDVGALNERPDDPIVEYVVSSQAQLKFVINSAGPAWGYPILNLEIRSTDKLCAESNLTLDGQQLNSNWNGIQGTGEGSLAAYGNAHASWTITCLWDSGGPTEGSAPDLGNITHLLALKLRDVPDRQTTPAFTVSYKQSGQPSIVRFAPHYTVPTRSNGDYPEWRIPTYPFAVELPTAPESPRRPKPPTLPQPSLSDMALDTQQKSLAAEDQNPSGRIESEPNSVPQWLKELCPKKVLQALKAQAMKAQQALKSHAKAENQHHEPIADSVRHGEDEADEVSPEVKVATPVQRPSAAETRSIHSGTTSTTTAFSVDGHSTGVPSSVVLKSFFLSLILLSLLTWTILRCRDPRCRAERAARREERQTKRLYRRAARRQKINNMIWKFRMRYGLASEEVLRLDEKRRRVSEHEEVLENVVKNDIEALRDAHRIVSSMTGTSLAAAEEGRTEYVGGWYGFGHRRLRSMRSVSTLPEYGSEGSRPPSYREPGRRDSMNEFTSDSSVVSTSPRISRDGTNSDYGEKIEELNLPESRADATVPHA